MIHQSCEEKQQEDGKPPFFPIKWGFPARAVGNKMRIKAAGGIHTLKEAIKMIEAGADRIGSSKGVAIVRSLKSSKTKY